LACWLLNIVSVLKMNPATALPWYIHTSNV